MRVVVMSFLSLMASTSTCFFYHRTTCHSHHDYHRCGRNRITTSRHQVDVASTHENNDASLISSWEEQLRQEAMEALLPVFFPKESDDGNDVSRSGAYNGGGGDGVRQRRNCIITAESSLKQLLRNKYRRDDSATTTTEEDAGTPIRANTNTNSSRRRLAALVLGTSIMRLRHWYSVVFVVGGLPLDCMQQQQQQQQQQQHFSGAKIPIHLIPYPLDPNLLAVLSQSDHITNDGDGCSDGGGDTSIDSLEEASIPSLNTDSFSTGQRFLVRAMVDEHARYISSQSLMSDDHDDEKEDALSIHLQSTSSYNTAMKLSILYSLPPFLTASLLSQFGYEQTKQICAVTNRPGPITFRKNAIQFSGTDDELCKWLKEEDGIDARSMRWKGEGLQWCARGRNNNLLISAASNGSTINYIVGRLSPLASSGPGTIMPPEGAIELINDAPLTSSLDATITSTTTDGIEQQKRRKSIWSTKGWKNGYFEAQDAGSQVIVQSLEVVPGMSILDYCAGNGGKTLGLASSIMAHAAKVAHPPAGKEGRHSTFSTIVAHDVVEERLRQIEGSMMRAGFVINENGNDGMKGGRRSYISQKRHGDYNCTIEISTSTDLTVEYSSPTLRFDAVLVDAPCSSTGVLRRRPSQRWDLTEAQMYDALPKLQLEILEKAASFVGTAGGRLVYSTCSILREENEGVAKMFESSDIYREGGFERWDFVPVVTSDGHSYAENDTMNDDGCSNVINLLPSKSGSDGFFIARWKRRKN